jgi:hypothetical protein
MIFVSFEAAVEGERPEGIDRKMTKISRQKKLRTGRISETNHKPFQRQASNNYSFSSSQQALDKTNEVVDMR